MRIWIPGAGATTLTKADFVSSGGEGKVYARGATAYKIYTDPRRVLPEAKLLELQALTDPRFVKPERLVLDARGRPVGFTMRYVEAAAIDPEQRHRIYEGNARRVYPRLDAALKAKGR